MNAPASPTFVRRLGYDFTDANLLALALTHRSHGQPNNERLEFLGDAVLNMVIAEALFERFAQAHEGQLSRLRANLVKGATLADVAGELQVGSELKLGQGELSSGGQQRESILADALEALIGAIYTDAGWHVVRQWVLQLFSARLAALQLDDVHKDAKTRLQEWLQARRQPLPVYQVQRVEGKAHMQRFTVLCQVMLLSQPCSGEGASRRRAEQCAAANALAALQELEHV